MARPYSQARTFLRRGEPVPAPDPNAPQKSYLLPIPLFHTTGCHAVMIPLIAGGGKLVFMHKWDPELALQIIKRERITGTGGVPTITIPRSRSTTSPRSRASVTAVRRRPPSWCAG